MTSELQLYGNKVYGAEVSEYGLKKGYLDYAALAEIIGNRVRNNNLREQTYGWKLVSGVVEDEIFQDYIITEWGYDFLREHTDEAVFYNEDLEMYIWGIQHWGTSWDYVLTDIKLIDEGTES